MLLLYSFSTYLFGNVQMIRFWVLSELMHSPQSNKIVVPSSKLKPAAGNLVVQVGHAKRTGCASDSSVWYSFGFCWSLHRKQRFRSQVYKQFFLIRNVVYVVAPQQLRSVHLFYFVLFRNKFRAHIWPILFSVIWIRWQASRILA